MTAKKKPGELKKRGRKPGSSIKKHGGTTTNNTDGPGNANSDSTGHNNTTGISTVPDLDNNALLVDMAEVYLQETEIKLPPREGIQGEQNIQAEEIEETQFEDEFEDEAFTMDTEEVEDVDSEDDEPYKKMSPAKQAKFYVKCLDTYQKPFIKRVLKNRMFNRSELKVLSSMQQKLYAGEDLTPHETSIRKKYAKYLEISKGIPLDLDEKEQIEVPLEECIKKYNKSASPEFMLAMALGSIIISRLDIINYSATNID
jgi:hypothetical protein